MKNPTPVIVLGGQQNTLSVARSLGRRGIPVSVSARNKCWALRSRYCHRKHICPDDVDIGTYWAELLLSDSTDDYHGNILLACDDDAVEFLAKNRDPLASHYLVDYNNPSIQLDMLNKKKTLEMARAAGCPTPEFWEIDTLEDVLKLEGKVKFPVILKPLHSHLFRRQFPDRKYLSANDFDELISKAKDAANKGVQVMICEMIPGPDDLACSYYTYVDEDSTLLFNFTKRCIRRYPVNEGGGTLQITEWLPEVAELGKRFFAGTDYRGLGNIEFKRDLRDGQLKVIEVNPRFTAVQEQITRSGIDIAFMIYCRLTGLPLPRIDTFKEYVRQWEPRRDIDAFRELRSMGAIDFRTWLKSVLHWHVVPYFSLNDPWPCVAKSLSESRATLSRRLSRISRFLRDP
ncbi:MAG: carboxylate--amine ligase [Planctomycetes bacterium]|nr:carboxylate--amine ligase [Planctomycetota bacterium]